MPIDKCPICNSPLEEILAAPCDDCGGKPEELADFQGGEREYFECEALSGWHLVLCDFCEADFASYNPEVFGLPKGSTVEKLKLRRVKKIQSAQIEADKCCPICGHRSNFLKLILESRRLHKDA